MPGLLRRVANRPDTPQMKIGPRRAAEAFLRPRQPSAL